MNQNFTLDVGKRVKYYRNRLKITQAELAEKAGCSNNHISALERGLYSTRIDILANVALALNVSTDVLLFGEYAELNQNLIRTLNIAIKNYGEENLCDFLVSLNNLANKE